MTRQTNTEKARTLRDKRAREGLAEVRGVWWPAHEHAQYKALAKAAPLLLDALISARDRATVIDPVTYRQMSEAIKATEPAQRMRKEGKK
jgi:hypothetical protein